MFNPDVESFTLFTNISFIIDIVLTFNTALHEDDKLITDRLQIIKSYLAGWFVLDIVSILPLDEFKLYWLKSLKILRILKVLRLLKLMRMTKIMTLSSSFYSSEF